MSSKSRLFLALCTAPFLAACGGSGDSETAPPTFTEMEASATALAAIYASESARTDVPTVGTASYAGYVGGDLDDGRDLIGELELMADFASTNVTGTADNFLDSNDQAFVGTLDFDGNVVFGGSSGVDDVLDGNLTGNLDADGTTYDTQLIILDSAFKGGSGAETPDAVSGSLIGDLDDINAPGPTIIFDAEFIAEKQ